MRASIDIGSNSTLLLLGDVTGEKIKVTEDRANVTALGKGIDKTKLFANESMEATYQVISDYKKTCDRHGVSPQKIIATATEASRVVSNAHSFFQKIENNLGIKIRIISAEGEAYYTALGVSAGDPAMDEVVAICDIGGASTELILFNTQKKVIEDFISLPLGSVRLNDWNEEGSSKENLTKIYQNFQSSKLTTFQAKKMIWTAGTMTALSAVIQDLKTFDVKKIHQSSFKRFALKKLHEGLCRLKISDLNENFPYLGKRANTLVSGAQVALQLSEWLKIDEFKVSNFGLRHGTLFQGEIDERYLVK